MRPSYSKPRHLIKRIIPSPGKIRELNLHVYFGSRIHDSRLWVVNRQSIARATAIGIFCAYLPMPMQMLLAALLAIVVRANLPISVLLVWISNPLTWVVIYTPPYLLGLAILGETGMTLQGITIEMMMDQLAAIWIGCLIFGVALGAGGYILANVVWRMMIMNQWTRRREQRRQGKKAERPNDPEDREGRS